MGTPSILTYEQIFKDYTEKIKNKIFVAKPDTHEKCSAVNSLVIFFNYCFQTKNSFFVPDFNPKFIFRIGIAYNILKTNIVSHNQIYDVKNIFENIKITDLKSIKFILNRYARQTDKIKEEHPDLHRVFDRKTAEIILLLIQEYIDESEKIKY